MIYVTKSFLPPREDYQRQLNRIWKSHIVTNRGPLAVELESLLRERWNIDHFLFVSNGTIALQLLIQLFEIKGEVITTPFSYVATTSSLIWEGCRPVFVDVDASDFCIDPALIEARITPQTSAILATHVFGNPCQVQKIESIAKKHGLKVIYDAAHAFDVELEGRSVLGYGDGSSLSFHATKIFHTGEGGGIALTNGQGMERLKLLHSFGHRGDDHFICGINGKASELHAAMGLANLPHLAEITAGRRRVSELYDEALQVPGLSRQRWNPQATRNHAYYPVVFSTSAQLEIVLSALKANDVLPRRYFYPSLNQLPYVQGEACPVSESLAARILCLPLYYDLPDEDVKRISRIVNEAVR